MNPEVPIIILILAIPTYCVCKWIMKWFNIENDKNRKFISNYRYVFPKAACQAKGMAPSTTAFAILFSSKKKVFLVRARRVSPDIGRLRPEGDHLNFWEVVR